jgi:hypothetical protein
MGAKELAWFGEFGRVICRANITDVTTSVYRLSSGFLGWLVKAGQWKGTGCASGGRNGLESDLRNVTQGKLVNGCPTIFSAGHRLEGGNVDRAYASESLGSKGKSSLFCPKTQNLRKRIYTTREPEY